MPTVEHMTAAVHAYVDAFERGDPELAVALFADDATIEDPIETPLKIGTDAIREFYNMSMASGAKLVLEGPIRIGGSHAAFAFAAQLKMNDSLISIHVIDIFRFNDAGKVIEMKAYFGPTNMSQA